MNTNNGLIEWVAIIDAGVWWLCIGTWQSPYLADLKIKYPVFARKFFSFFQNASYFILTINIILYIAYTRMNELNLFSIIFYISLLIFIIFLLKSWVAKSDPRKYKMFKNKWLNSFITNNAVTYIFCFLLVNFALIFIKNIP